MWYYGWGPMPVLGAACMLLFWTALVLLTVWAVRTFGPTGSDRRRDPAVERLRDRLAGGEISLADFDQAARALGGPTAAGR